MMPRRSTRITSAIEWLGTLPESKQNDVNDDEIEIESHPPPPLNKRERVEAKEYRERRVLKSVEKQVQEVEERHAKHVKKHKLNKVGKQLDVVDASHKSYHKDNNNDNDNNDDEDDDEDDDNNDDDTLTLTNVVKGKKFLMARRC